MKKAFITGITGQDGSYLTELLLEKGYEVHGMVRRHSSMTRERLDPIRDQNPRAKDHLQLYYGDMNDGTSLHVLIEKIRPDEIYNLASQSHVKVSFEQPDYTDDIVGNGTVRLLEANRQTGVMAKFYQASSSEMFGKPDQSPQNEATPLRPLTPYGAAKAFAHHMCRIYRDSYGMHTSSGILYNHESPRRGENFVTRKICQAVARIAKGLQQHVELGNLEGRRDWGYAPEYVDAMWKTLQQKHPDDYVIGTGKLHSVRDLLKIACDHVGLDYHNHVVTIDAHKRPSMEVDLVADVSKAKKQLGWQPITDFATMIGIMVDFELHRLNRSHHG